MDDQQAIQTIDNFISMRFYHYALMINGKWGCGKTHFVQNVLIPHIMETDYVGIKKDVNYVSLYGIRNAESITEQLCSQAIKDYIRKRNDKIKTEGKMAGITSIILSTAIKWGMAKADVSSDGLNKIVELLPNYDNNVIIFDDLERCCCDVNEVLGFINNFIEHSNAAVIIVANEEEIGNWTNETNTALEMMIALDDRLNVQIPKNQKDLILDFVNSNGDSNKQTLEQVNKKRSMIFQKSGNYLRAREKVIGQTISYEPDLVKVYPSLVFQHIGNTKLLNALMETIDDLIDLAHRESHTNIRTFLFFLEKIKTIFDAIDSQYPTIHNAIILYCFRSSIRHTKGEAMPIWDNDYGQQSFGNGLSANDYCMGFRFIDTLISSNTMDTDYANSVLHAFSNLAEKKGQLTNDPYQLIQTWWRSDEKQVEGWLKDINDSIKKGKYSIALYPEIIRYISELEADNLFTDICSEIIQSMRDFIQNAKRDCLEEFEREQFFLEGEKSVIFRKHYNELKELLDLAMQSSDREHYLALINGENQDKWSEKLQEDTKNMRFIRGRSFIYWIDPHELFIRIKNSSNAQIYIFRLALNEIYSMYTNYQHKNDDYTNLSSLKKLLEKEDTSKWDRIKNLQKEWLIADLKKYCKMIDDIQKNSHDSSTDEDETR